MREAYQGAVCRDVRRTSRAPLGYCLNMFAWYIDQTVGGAVATGTHGSSLKWGSLSSQVRIRRGAFPSHALPIALHMRHASILARRYSHVPFCHSATESSLSCMQVSRIELALANGSLLELTPQRNPHLFRAAQVITPCHCPAFPRAASSQTHVELQSPRVLPLKARSR